MFYTFADSGSDEPTLMPNPELNFKRRSSFIFNEYLKSNRFNNFYS